MQINLHREFKTCMSFVLIAIGSARFFVYMWYEIVEM